MSVSGRDGFGSVQVGSASGIVGEISKRVTEILMLGCLDLAGISVEGGSDPSPSLWCRGVSVWPVSPSVRWAVTESYPAPAALIKAIVRGSILKYG